MQRNVNSLIGVTIGATDGDIGSVKEFYFEDNNWKVRYLIVKTGSWLSGRHVLISPDALIKDSRQSGTFPVNLTKEQVRNSPDIDTDRPVSRRQEIELYGHYEWQPYWGAGFYAGGFENVSRLPVIDERIIKESGNTDKQNENDPHLRSTNRVTGYHIHASDGDIGHVNDFILDDQTWEISHLVVDTHNWLGGKKVLIPVLHIQKVQWEESKVFVDMPIDAIKSSPEFDGSEYGMSAAHVLEIDQ